MEYKENFPSVIDLTFHIKMEIGYCFNEGKFLQICTDGERSKK
ncbi:hypothetical protein [Bacillus aerolatus]|nr:hypothetical protein [Bacillus aerolatus]